LRLQRKLKRGRLDHGLALDAKTDLIPDHRISIDPFGDVVLMDTKYP